MLVTKKAEEEKLIIRYGFPRAKVAVASLTLFLLLASVLLISNAPASAAGIQIAPLKYQTNLNGKTMKGSVDITNQSATTQNITIQVQAFKQVNNKGDLQFYSNPLITSGITPDYNQFTLKPYERIHLYFLLNGRELPKKRIFAALLAQAEPVQSSYNITPILRVGTLLMLKNGNGDQPKQGKISNWHVGLFQFGSGISGSFNFKNTEKGGNSSGYFANFKVTLAGASDSFSSDLVFPGISRPQSFYLPASRIGLYRLNLTSDTGASSSQWVFVLTGFWRWLLPLIVFLAITVAMVVAGLRKSTKQGNRGQH